jgi:hypothetical protein
VTERTATGEPPPIRGLVLVVGPDGAGKTTVLDEVERQLGRPLARAHSRPGVIAGRGGDGSPVTDPHAGVPRGTLLSLAKLAVVFLDTLVGSLVRWRRSAADDLLVVERGWYDLAVDPRRYRLPDRFAPLVRTLGRLLPKADVTVLLTGDPAAFHARKPEIGVAEVTRQLGAWERYAAEAGRRVVRIDTVTRPAETAAAELLTRLGARRRWYRVPVGPRRLGMVATGPGPALSVYRPHRPVAAALTTLNGPLLRSRFARPAAPPPVPDLEAVLTRAGRPAQQLAAFRSSAPGRWIVAAADRAGLHTVVKVGPASDGTTREVAALHRLSSSETVEIPTVLADARVDGWHLAALSALPNRLQPTLEQVTDVATALVRGDLGVPVVHGDLAPWNLAVAGDRVAVWDWEEAELDAVRPLHDLAHYLVRTGTLLGRYHPTEVADLLLARDGPGGRHLAALDLDIVDAAAHVRAYLDRTGAASRDERAFRDGLAASLPIGVEGTPSHG